MAKSNYYGDYYRNIYCCNALLPIAKDTSFSDLTVTFEVWIFFGIFIIMNSKIQYQGYNIYTMDESDNKK